MKMKKTLIFNFIIKLIMSRLTKTLQGAKDHAWEAFKDTFFPRKLRRTYNNRRLSTKLYYPFNPNLGNACELRDKEKVEFDHRTPFKDSQREYIRYEYDYFRK